MESAQVGVVLVNFQGAADTLACLRALSGLASPPLRILVVDNASGDGSARTLREACESWPGSPRPEVLALPENLGFAGGCNAALRLLLADSRCRGFWLLNPDTLPAPGALDALCARMNALPRAGACGSLLVHTSDGTGGDGTGSQVQCAAGGRYNALLGTTAHLLEGEGAEAARRTSPEQVEEQLDYICGASLLLTRQAAETVGLLDASYFLYYEDVDYGLRLRRAGFTLGFAPASLVEHRVGGSTGADASGAHRPPLVDYLGLRNRVRLTRLRHPQFLPSVLAGFGVVVARRIRRGQADRIPLALRAAWRGLAGETGLPSWFEK